MSPLSGPDDSAAPGEDVPAGSVTEQTDDAEPVTPDLPLLRLRDGLPPVTETPAALAQACAAIAAGTGPVAVDAERASGYRYSGRAYLVQLRREGAGTFLIDPIGFESLAPLQEAIGEAEWILHAATQDLPCLAQAGLFPAALFDSELAGRLLGYPRVGLATLVEVVLGHRMKKEHSAADWSRRPLPQPWLEYAALDVEPLVELREALAVQLIEAGKADWANQEFEHLLGFQQTPRVEAWRRTSGLHRVRGRRGLGAARAMWEARDDIARRRDVTPGRILPDSALVVAAQAMPGDRDALLALKGFHGRGADRYASRWISALHEATTMDERDLPERTARSDGPPAPRAWADRDPVAGRRLALARVAMAELAERVDMPVENLLTPDLFRRVLWAPPTAREPADLAAATRRALFDLGARTWQVDLVAPIVVDAVLGADEPVASPPATDGADPDEPAVDAPPLD